MFLKAIEKHNLLTKKREKVNGGPLFFPDDNTFIALPKDFLKEEEFIKKVKKQNYMHI